MWQPSNMIQSFQRCTLFECHQSLYIVGYDKIRNEYAILTIPKGVEGQCGPLELIGGDQRYLTSEVIVELKRIGLSPGFRKILNGYGLIGIIELIRGHYLIVITKHRKVCRLLGSRSIYTVEKTQLVPLFSEIPLESEGSLVATHCDEKPAFEKKAFGTLTGFVQKIADRVSALASLRTSGISHTSTQKDEFLLWTRLRELLGFLNVPRHFYFSYTHNLTMSLQWNRVMETITSTGGVIPPKLSDYVIGGTTFECPFFWNYLHTSFFRNNRSELQRWIVPLIHGYVGYARCCDWGRNFEITLIARRSRFFAGTRYRKRGINESGHVANDVETEQILFGLLNRESMSFTQNRSSVPLFWSQEVNAIVPKPPILYTKSDPTLAATRRHFEDFFSRYGAPLIVVNLMKSTKRAAHEFALSTNFEWAMRNLNKELPEDFRIRFIGWDIKAAHRQSTAVVHDGLTKLADEIVDAVGYFHETGPDVRPLQLQVGVLRTNCVDCLDRTNVAQFFVGRGVLGHQLKILGLIRHLPLPLESLFARILSDMYDAMGDVLALQYGGSVTHKKFSQHYSRVLNNPKEILTSIQRHATNVFADFERQTAINLFLGLIKPKSKQRPWTFESDVWLHQKALRPDFIFRDWWTHPLLFFWQSHQSLLFLPPPKRLCLITSRMLKPSLPIIEQRFAALGQQSGQKSDVQQVFLSQFNQQLRQFSSALLRYCSARCSQLLKCSAEMGVSRSAAHPSLLETLHYQCCEELSKRYRDQLSMENPNYRPEKQILSQNVCSTILEEAPAVLPTESKISIGSGDKILLWNVHYKPFLFTELDKLLFCNSLNPAVVGESMITSCNCDSDTPSTSTEPPLLLIELTTIDKTISMDYQIFEDTEALRRCSKEARSTHSIYNSTTAYITLPQISTSMVLFLASFADWKLDQVKVKLISLSLKRFVETMKECNKRAGDFLVSNHEEDLRKIRKKNSTTPQFRELSKTMIDAFGSTFHSGSSWIRSGHTHDSNESKNGYMNAPPQLESEELRRLQQYISPLIPFHLDSEVSPEDYNVLVTPYPIPLTLGDIKPQTTNNEKQLQLFQPPSLINLLDHQSLPFNIHNKHMDYDKILLVI